MIIWKTEHMRGERPQEIDEESTPGKVLVRRNIESEIIEEDGQEVTEWICEMTFMTYEEWGAYSQAESLRNQAAMDETMAEILLNQLEV